MCYNTLSSNNSYQGEQKMRIKKLQITTDAPKEYTFPASQNICLIIGRDSFETLDTIRILLGDQTLNKASSADFALHADVEIDGKSYSVCCIQSKDESRIAVNFQPYSTKFSLSDTNEYLSKIKSSDRSNVLDLHSTCKNDLLLSESDRVLHQIDEFILQNSQNNDRRPLFIYGALEHLDEAVDLSSLLNKISALKKQVFIAVEDKDLTRGINLPFVCSINTHTSPKTSWQELNVGDTYDGFYTVITCPICESKTLDNYWICPCCNWEYDGAAHDSYSSCNRTTPAKYRKHYKASQRRKG